MASKLQSLGRRWLINLAILYALLLALGVLIGGVAAVGGDGSLTGESSTVVYTPDPSRDPPGTPTHVVTPNDDPDAYWLFLGPFLALYWGTRIALPLAVFGLLIAEVLGWFGISETVLRRLAVSFTGFLALLILLSSAVAAGAFAAVWMVAYACLIRLPRPPWGRTTANGPPAA
jgi:hypothetical protein